MRDDAHARWQAAPAATAGAALCHLGGASPRRAAAVVAAAASPAHILAAALLLVLVAITLLPPDRAGGALAAGVASLAGCDGRSSGSSACGPAGGGTVRAGGGAVGGDAALAGGALPRRSLTDGSPAAPPLSLDDLIVVMPSSANRQALVNATRLWRRGVRTLVATDAGEDGASALSASFASLREVYVHFNDEPRQEGVKPLSRRPADHRAALAPLLAHEKYVGTYKWMLYGDDDTVFYLDAVLSLLSTLDASTPVAMTDNLWLLMTHPNPAAPRCAPCQAYARGGDGRSSDGGNAASEVAEGLQEAAAALGAGTGVLIPPPGCPACTPELACAPLLARKLRCIPPGAHGGAGILLSHGALEALPATQLQRCFRRNRGASGGDRLLSACMHHLNISFTDPALWVQVYKQHLAAAASSGGDAGAPSAADVFRRHALFDNQRHKKLMLDPMKAVTQGCDAVCQWVLHNMASLHVGARHLKSVEEAAKVMRTAVRSHGEALEVLRAQAAHEVR